MRRNMFLLWVIGIFFFATACGSSENSGESNGREVSSEIRTEVLWASFIEPKESGMVYEDAPIEFADPVAEEMLRNMIEKPEGEVYISDLQKIHAIYIHSDAGYYSDIQSPDSSGRVPRGKDAVGPWETKRIETLEDFKYCYNLQYLMLRNELVEFPSLEPLKELPQLEGIHIDTQLSEEGMKELGEITTLKKIGFGDIELFSLEAICNLPQLEALDFNETKVNKKVLEDIGKITTLKSLELGTYDPKYNLGTNWGELTDGSFLLPIADQLTSFYAAAGIAWNTDVLAQMTNMEKLGINHGTDMSFLEHMPNLRILDTYCCTPEDWKVLEKLEKLEFLDICGNMYVEIEIDLEELQAIPNLDYLSLTFTTINKEYKRDELVEALPNLTGLVYLLEW